MRTNFTRTAADADEAKAPVASRATTSTNQRPLLESILSTLLGGTRRKRRNTCVSGRNETVLGLYGSVSERAGPGAAARSASQRARLAARLPAVPADLR